ncbi:MAG: hypothetical protein PHV62_09070 [Sulfuricurvum sp.]|nr:hypothetical protein [Sulfuricurvum sp.]
MDWQQVANGLFVVVSFLGGILYRDIRSGMKEQESDLSKLATKIQGIEVLVAGDYVKKSDQDKLASALFKKLDQICEKLDRKVDRTHG